MASSSVNPLLFASETLFGSKLPFSSTTSYKTFTLSSSPTSTYSYSLVGSSSISLISGFLSTLSISFSATFSADFDVLNSSDPWEWFTDDVANSLLADSGASASTFSLRTAPVENDEVITSYYEDNLNDFYSWLDLVGDR